MEYNDVKYCLKAGLEFAGIDEASAATLLWRGQEVTLDHGEVIYAEGANLDQTFCLLLSGSVHVEKSGTAVTEISDPQFFGEMAYFTSPQTRRATVSVSSIQATILKFHLTGAELASPRFSTLSHHLSRQTWDRMMAL